MRSVVLVAFVAAAMAGCAARPSVGGAGYADYSPDDVWHYYVPPAPDRDTPPPFSTSTWIYQGSYDGVGCSGAGMALHYRAWNQGDRDLSMRALDGGCYNPRTGEFRP